MSLTELRADVVIVACAISAGTHGALVPGHFHEGTGAGLGFVAATAALAAVVLSLTRWPGNRPALGAAAAVLGGLLASYAVAVTTGFPVLHPDPEPVDGLALATKAIETVGLLAAASLLWGPVALIALRPRGT